MNWLLRRVEALGRRESQELNVKVGTTPARGWRLRTMYIICAPACARGTDAALALVPELPSVSWTGCSPLSWAHRAILVAIL